MNLKKIIGMFPVACMIAAGCNGNTEVIENGLRAPAYPLVTIDPYTSAWSMSDNLYDSPVRHWTGKEFPLLGVLYVDGVPYRFMGTEVVEFEPVLPSSINRPWDGKYTGKKPSGDWTAIDFNDSSWKMARGAFGTTINEPSAVTDWSSEHIWVRREFELSSSLEGEKLYLEYSNDDNAEFYINGVKVFDTGAVCHKNEYVQIPAEAVAALRPGRNVISATCWNPVANGLLDFGIYRQKPGSDEFDRTAVQKYADVQATQTHYGFTCGPVDLRLTFSAPLFLEDLELVSRPVNYMTYSVASNDGAAHEVEIYFEASPRWALNDPHQESVSETFIDNGLAVLRTGSKAQKILSRSGDDLRIDWGYFYMAASQENAMARVGEDNTLDLLCELGKTSSSTGRVLLGYDDIYSIQYFGTNLRPYWNRDGKSSILEQLHKADKEYKGLIEKCYRFDQELMEKATAAGGKEYADLCALAYRQCIAAHKLVESPSGELLWFSKENNSNGSIGTVDITYPSSPLFLYYNTEFAKGMMNHIYDYSESGRWTKPFPAHDVGTYPLANGQTYGGDMPVEEAGNMITLTAAVCVMDKDASYAEKHWDVLTTWTEYLSRFGLDPENQLCTDDFAGHFAHNANLSVKAIVAIASYGRMAQMLGKADVAEKYTAMAREMAAQWVKMADDGDHFRLTFDRPDTWSQKYNLVWDKLLNLGIFPKEVYDKEIAYYLGKQNRYGLPLDSRMAYTKTDWIMWTATLADDKETFGEFVYPVYRFMDETVDRVPMSDWIWTDRPNWRGFKARSVVGGYFIKMLEEKL